MHSPPRIQEKVKPVVDQFAPQTGEDFVKGFYAEIDKARAPEQRDPSCSP